MTGTNFLAIFCFYFKNFSPRSGSNSPGLQPPSRHLPETGGYRVTRAGWSNWGGGGGGGGAAPPPPPPPPIKLLNFW